jgi:hypothetical protein
MDNESLPTGMAMPRRHPVGGQAHIRQFADPRGGNIGDGFAHRHAAGGWCIEQRERGTLAHGHRLTRETGVTRSGNGHITDWHR